MHSLVVHGEDLVCADRLGMPTARICITRLPRDAPRGLLHCTPVVGPSMHALGAVHADV